MCLKRGRVVCRGSRQAHDQQAGRAVPPAARPPGTQLRAAGTFQPLGSLEELSHACCSGEVSPSSTSAAPGMAALVQGPAG